MKLSFIPLPKKLSQRFQRFPARNLCRPNLKFPRLGPRKNLQPRKGETIAPLRRHTNATQIPAEANQCRLDVILTSRRHCNTTPPGMASPNWQFLDWNHQCIWLPFCLDFQLWELINTDHPGHDFVQIKKDTWTTQGSASVPAVAAADFGSSAARAEWELVLHPESRQRQDDAKQTSKSKSEVFLKKMKMLSTCN